jgi:hypothetical protein
MDGTDGTPSAAGRLPLFRDPLAGRPASSPPAAIRTNVVTRSPQSTVELYVDDTVEGDRVHRRDVGSESPAGRPAPAQPSAHHGDEAAAHIDIEVLAATSKELDELTEQFNHFKRAFLGLQGGCQRAMERIKRENTAQAQRREYSERQIRILQQNGPRRVRLNVGGTIFEVSESLLLKYPGTFFSVLLEGNFAIDTDDSGAIFIDRDPILFRDILYFLRTGNVPLAPSRPCCRCQLGAGQRPPASAAGASGGRQEADLLNSAELATNGALAAAPVVSARRVGSFAGGVVPSASGNSTDFTAVFKMLEEEARFYGLTELCMKLTADRGVWHRQDEHHVVSGSVPTPRCFAASAIVDPDSIYFFGGCTADDNFFDAFYCLRVSESSLAAATAAQRVPLAAGSSGPVAQTASPIPAGANSDAAPFAAVPTRPAALRNGADAVDTYTWHRIRPRFGSAPSPRSGHTLSYVAGHLIVIGGNNSISMETSCHSYSLTACGWTPVRNAGEPLHPRSGHTVTVIDNKLYLIGGKQIFPTMLTYSDVLVGVFDAEEATITWSRAPLNMDVDQRAYHSAIGYRESIFVFGGIVNNVYCRELCQYDTMHGVWTNITPASRPGYTPPPPRSGHIAVLYGNEMVVFGSYSEDTQHMTLLSLDLETMHWRHVDTVGPGPLRRAAPSGAVIAADSFRGKAARLVVFGGFDIAARRCFNEVHAITL